MHGGPTPRKWLILAVIFGVLGLLCYAFSVPIQVLPPELGRYLFMSVGPSLAITVYAAGHIMAARFDTASLRIAVMMLVVAGAFYSAMTVTQNLNFSVMGAWIEAADDQAKAELTRQIMWGVNNVQAALDFAYDIWLTVGGLFLAIAVLRHPWFGPIFAWTGVAVQGGLLFLNAYTFPWVPAESGLFDLGPAVGLWFAALLIQAVRMMRKEPVDFWDRAG